MQYKYTHLIVNIASKNNLDCDCHLDATLSTV